MKIFIALLFLMAANAHATTLSEAQLRAEQLKLWESPTWLRLLHYVGGESQADGMGFFAAQDGYENPKAEMLATLAGFYSTQQKEFKGNKVEKQTAYCQYPARWSWLSKQLQIQAQDIPTQECPEYQEYKARVAAKSVTLVFSSYFLNSPSSTFGHSLLRLNKGTQADGTEHSQLLDYGVNYAASMITDNPIIYSIGGLAGLLPGVFTKVPYYYKVREYNDHESRDLWEYDLNLTQDEVDQLIAHMWELGFTYFSYYYLTENCSYHMLSILEAAAPRLNLVSRLHYWVIPADTIKVVYETPGLVKNIQFRASARTLFTQRLENLSPNQKAILSDVIETRNAKSENLLSLDEQSKADIQDSVLDYLDYKHTKDLFYKKEDVVQWKQDFLVSRSKNTAPNSLKVQPADLDRPHISHASGRYGFSYLLDAEQNHGIEGAIRFALHDLLDPIQGYPSFAKIEFLHFRLQYFAEPKLLILKEALFFSVETLSSLKKYERALSWRFKMGAENVNDLRCENCTAGVIAGAAGYTWDVLRRPNIAQYFLIAPSINFGNFRGNTLSAGIGPVFGMRFVFTPQLIALGEASWQKIFHKENQEQSLAKAGMRWAPNLDFSIDAQMAWNQLGQEISVGLFKYF